MALLGNLTASPAGAATVLRQMRQAQRADGPASVLAVGTANPPNCVRQDEYADYYFRVTHTEHHTKLKAKLNRICKLASFFLTNEEKCTLDHLLPFRPYNTFSQVTDRPSRSATSTTTRSCCSSTRSSWTARYRL
jgi:hypothetical protein